MAAQNFIDFDNLKKMYTDMTAVTVQSDKIVLNKVKHD